MEWSAQVLQLAHAGRTPELRTTSTIGALQAAVRAGLLSADDGGVLASTWILASRLRSAIVLGTGRASGPRSQVLPVQVREIRLVGRLIGLGSGKERELEDLYRRSARHTRAVAERIVFTDGTAHGSPPSAPTPSTSTSVSQDQSAEPAPAAQQARPGMLTDSPVGVQRRQDPGAPDVRVVTGQPGGVRRGPTPGADRADTEPVGQGWATRIAPSSKGRRTADLADLAP